MKFSCEKLLLQSAVATASRAVAAKSTIPALEGVLLQAGSQLTVSGYNMQTGIRTTLETDVTEEGALVLPARLFGEIIRRLPDDIVTFASDKGLNVHPGCTPDLRRRRLQHHGPLRRGLPGTAGSRGPIRPAYPPANPPLHD